MSTTQMISRRKPATYGKSTRKPLTQYFEPSSLDPPKPSSGTVALQSGRAALRPEEPRNHIYHPSRDHAPPKACKKSSLSEMSSGSSTVATAAGSSREREAPRCHGSWDLPSPDRTDRNVEANEVSTRKKRTVAARSPKVTAQNSHGRRNASFPHTSTIETTNTSTLTHVVDDNALSKPNYTPKRATASASYASAPTSSRNRAAYGQRSSPITAEHIGPSSPPAPCTPLGRKCVIKETTPRQQELWSMLLPGHTKLGPEGRSLGSPKSSFPQSPPLSSPEAKPATYSKRRGRIVDKLQNPIQTSQTCTTTSSACQRLPSPEENKLLDLSKGPPSNTNERALLPSMIPRATYSSQRSYLATGMSDDTSSFSVPLVDRGQKPRKRLRTETMSLDTESVQEADFDGSQGNSMRTVHELRESGENVRHLNDTEALFDDIDGQSMASMSLKRRRLLDLIHRMYDPAFCRLMFDQGFDNRLLAESASRGNDAVADALLAVAVLYLVATPLGRQAASEAYDLQIAELFASKLDRDQNLIVLIRNRRSNLSKQDQLDLNEYFIDELLQSPVWRSGAPVSPSVRLIALQGLEYFIRTRREFGCKTKVLPPETIQRLVQGLLSAQRTVAPSVDLLLEVRLAVSILESYTISGVDQAEQQWTKITLRPLTTVLPWLTHLPETGGEEMYKLTLRLYLNLTNNNPKLCEAFAGHEVIRAMVSLVGSHFQTLSDREQGLGGSDVLDTLILSLGTLINLVEWSPIVRELMTATYNEDDCFLGTLVKLFVARQNAMADVCSEEETSSNVPFGYLSVLLSYLCVGENARQRVAKRLPGGTLQALLNTVVEFLQYHRQIDDDIGQEDGETHLKSSFISRLESTVIELERMR